MHISVVGTGYVGLVTGACLADFCWNVTCIDQDQAKIEGLQSGRPPFYEPGLLEIVQKGMEEKRLTFSTNLEESVAKSDVIFIAVGTPPTPQGDLDLTALYDVAHQLAPCLKHEAVVVIKSTVPVGTSRAIDEHISQLNPQATCWVASNPEFLREGCAVEDFMNPDRIVVGATAPQAIKRLKRLYHPLIQKRVPFLSTTCQTSELIKYASNAFLATKISFINEMARLCEHVDADVEEVALGMGLDQRIGGAFLKAGPGYGGSCFPKDTRALAKAARHKGAPLSIVEAVVEANEQTKQRMVEKIRKACGGELQGQTLGILGITFKANTDDLRDSPSLTILPQLQEAGATLQVYDPKGMEIGESLFEKVAWCHNSYAAANGANALVIVTEWDVFSDLDFNQLNQIMKNPLLIDLRNMYPPDQVEQAGFAYVSLGRSSGSACPVSSTTVAA